MKYAHSFIQQGIPVILLASLLFAGCAGSDSQARLDALRKKKSEIELEIQALEKEIGAQPANAAAGKVTDVIVTPVTKAPFAHYVDVQGSVQADEAVELRPVMAGTVTKINVSEGDFVQKGQVLAETDNEIYVKQLNSLQPQLQLATELYDRQSRLWAQKIGSEVQYLQAKTQKEALEKQIETLQEQIDLSRIKSPIQGTVDFVGLKIGQLAAANLVQPAFRVVNLNSLKAVAQLAESSGSRIRKGNTVQLAFPDLGQEAVSKITFTSRTIDPMTRTFAAHASLPDNPDYRPNMVVIMRVMDYENPEAVVVPVNLIQSGNNEQFVYVATTNPEGRRIANRRVLKLGKSYGSDVEVLSGLLEGDQLITTGFNQLIEGSEIKF
jgi:membrane fusion protein, multidrug efflux system